MIGKRVGLVLTALVLFSLAMGGAMLWQSAASPGGTLVSADAGAQPQQTAVPTSTPPPLQEVPQPPRGAALPGTDTPFHRVAAELERRAAEGEPAASCRLASEYLHCSRLPARRASMDRWLEQQQRAVGMVKDDKVAKGLTEAIDQQMRQRQTDIDGLVAHCGTVAVPDAPEIARMWRKAALAGNPAAMKQYASGNAFRWNSMLEALPELAMYRQEAERIATVAASRGDMDLLLALAAGYDPTATESRSMLAQVVRPDAARSLALYRHAEAALGAGPSQQAHVALMLRDRIDTLERRLPAEQRMRSESIARLELARWRAPVVRGRVVDTSGRTPDIQSGWCEREN